MADRDQYLLRCLVTAQRERKMAMKTRDPGLIKSAETRLAVAWKNATDHVDATTRAAILASNSGVRGTVPADPCAPRCEPGGVCKTPTCGRLRSSELMRLYGTADGVTVDRHQTFSQDTPADPGKGRE